MEQVDEESGKHHENRQEIQQVRNGKDNEMVQEEEHYGEIGSGEENEGKHEKVTSKEKKKKIKKVKDENVGLKKDKNGEKDGTAKIDDGRKNKYLDKLGVKEKIPDRDSEKENRDEDENMLEGNFQKDENYSTEENYSNEEQDEDQTRSKMKYYSFSSDTSLYLSSRSSESFSQTPSYSSEDNYPPETSPVFEIHKKLSVIDLVDKEISHSEDSPKDTSCTDELTKRMFSTKVKIDEATSTEEYPNDTPHSKKSSTDVSAEDDTDTTLPSSDVSTKLRLSSGVDQKMPPPKELTGSCSPKKVLRRRSRKKYRKRYPRKQFRTKYLVKNCDKPRRTYRRKPHPIIKFRNPQSDVEESSELEINSTSLDDDYGYRLRNSSHENGDSKKRKIAANASKSSEKEDDYCKRICGKRIVSYTSKESKMSRELESSCSLDTGDNSISLEGNTDYLNGFTATVMSNNDYDVIVEDYEEVVVSTEVDYDAQWDHKSESDKIAELCDMIDEGPCRNDAVNANEESFITEANSSSGGKMNIGRKSRKTKIEESKGTESDRNHKQKKAKTEDLLDKNGNWQ